VGDAGHLHADLSEFSEDGMFASIAHSEVRIVIAED
jgi:hypothetical protein